MTVPCIKTQRLVMRALVLSDGDACVACLNNLNVSRW
jgi:hypothetical protein